MAASRVPGSWSFIDTSAASLESGHRTSSVKSEAKTTPLESELKMEPMNSDQEAPFPMSEPNGPIFKPAPIDHSTVKLIVGPKKQVLTVNKHVFHKHIPGFSVPFYHAEIHGREQSLSLPQSQVKDVESLIKWMEGKKIIFTEQIIYAGLGYSLHKMMCFRIFQLAAHLNIQALMEETLGQIATCLGGGRWAVTIEAVEIAYRDSNPHMEALKAVLIWGAMDNFFADEEYVNGCSWKRVLEVNSEFEKAVFQAVGWHVMREKEQCLLERCYFHRSVGRR